MLHLVRAGGLGVAGLALAVAGLAIPASATEPSRADGDDRSGLSAAEARMLATDPAVDVAPDGTLFAVDEWTAPATAGSDAPPSAADDGTRLARGEALPSATLADTFTLHSRPGANRTIYLDFNGGTLLSSNSWLLNGLSTLLFPGWSLDGSASFSDAERTVVQEVWARVAEDYSPFDIDVTTQEPPAGALWRSSASDPTYGTRVAFASGGSIQTQLCGGACGGIAWIGTFDSVTNGETRSPAWVFPSSLGNKAKNMAEAASHEAGHTLGLGHDGTSSSGYYAGNTLWGPLMGSPYSAGVTQWSRGDYPSANNHEDDFAVLGANGASLRPDEAGSTPATALPLAALPGGTGVITGRDDRDWYAVTDCTGTVTASASPAPVGPNLDLRVELRDSAGTLLHAAAPATTRTSAAVTGLGATVTGTLRGGPYYVAVSGAGSLSGGGSGWSTGGYDSYGSAGTYRLSVSGCSGTPGNGTTDPPTDPPPPVSSGKPPSAAPATRPGTPRAAVVRPGARGGRLSVGVRWTPPATGGAAITGYVIKAFKLTAGGRVIATRSTAVLAAGTTSVQLLLPKGRWAVRVKARNKLGWSGFSPRSAAAKAR